MFCSNCGTQMDDADLFCPNCGTKVVDVENVPPTQPQYQYQQETFSENVNAEQVYAAPAYTAPVSSVSSGSSIGKYVGVGFGVLGIISLFLKVISIHIPEDISSFMKFMGVREGYGSWNFFQLMTEAEIAWLFWLTLISIILVIVLQLTNHPKLSLIGCLGMIFAAFILTVAMGDMPRQVRAYMKYGIGFYLFIISIIGCVISGIITRKKRK